MSVVSVQQQMQEPSLWNEPSFETDLTMANKQD